MNKVFKKCFLFIAFSVFVFSSTVIAFASSGGYSSTYDMTGGVYSNNISLGGDNASITVNISPTLGTYDCNMGIYVDKSYWYGWASPGTGTSSASVSSVVSSSTTFGLFTSGTYRVYLRDWAGTRWTGNCSFSWSW